MLAGWSFNTQKVTQPEFQWWYISPSSLLPRRKYLTLYMKYVISSAVGSYHLCYKTKSNGNFVNIMYNPKVSWNDIYCFVYMQYYSPSIKMFFSSSGPLYTPMQQRHFKQKNLKIEPRIHVWEITWQYMFWVGAYSSSLIFVLIIYHSNRNQTRTGIIMKDSSPWLSESGEDLYDKSFKLLKKEIKRISGDRKISTVHGPIGKT